jgi:hypothetical protein
MANDNNLLLIILIGIVLFWIFNINTTENFETQNNTNSAKNKNKYKYKSKSHSVEDFGNVKSNLTRNTDHNNIDPADADMINQLVAEQTNQSRDSVRSVSSSSSTNSAKIYANGIANNPKQELFEKPPTIRNEKNVANINRSIAQQYVNNDKQEMYPGDQPLGHQATRQDSYYNFNDESFMLMTKSDRNMLDPKFNKVMPPETRQTLASKDLLPKQSTNDWFQNPGENFNLLQAVDLEIPEIKIGIDTIGQSRKNASYDLRAAPPCPKFVVSPWQNSTIEPDYNIKPLC